MSSLRAFAAVMMFSLAASVHAQLIEGDDYQNIRPQAVSSGERIEVIEFFFYGCRSCYRLEPVLQAWVDEKSRDVDFRRIPALRRREWQPLSDLFYALDALGVLPQMHLLAYQAIHERGRKLGSRSEQIAWAAEHGIDAEKFSGLLGADATLIASQHARDATLAYGVQVTPSIVVDGRFLTTGEMIGRASRVTQVLDALVEMALAARQGKRP